MEATHFEKGLPLLGSIKISFGDYGPWGIFHCAAIRGVFQDLLLVAKLKSWKFDNLQSSMVSAFYLGNQAFISTTSIQYNQFIHNWICVPNSFIHLTEQLQILYHPYNPALHYQSQRLIVNIRSLEMLQAQCEDIEITPWYTLCFPRLKCCKENGSGDHNRTDNHHFRCRRLLDSLCVRLQASKIAELISC